MPGSLFLFFGRLRFGFLRRLLYLWHAGEYGNGAFSSAILDAEQNPSFYGCPIGSLSRHCMLRSILAIAHVRQARGLCPAGCRRQTGHSARREGQSYAFLSREQGLGRPTAIPRGQSPRCCAAISAVARTHC